MPIQQICTIAAVTKLNPYAYHFVLEAGKMGSLIRAGQFLHIKCGDSRRLRRPISICQWQEDEPEDLVSIVFEVRGEGTQWLAEREEGEKLDVLGPLGNGFSIRPEGRYLLVGGGIGVPPLVSCATPGSTAVLGFRSADRAMPLLVDRLKEKGCGVYITSDDGTIGAHGFVDAQMRAVLEQDQAYDAVLACGPKPMLRSVVKAAEAFGLPCQVSMEERMACGVGACLGCAVRMADGSMKHVCKDGPVFPAEEVDWDA